MRVASLVEQAQAAHDRRSALYQTYEDAINKYKATKDLTLFGSNRKKIDTDHKTLSQQIGTIQSKLKAEGADASDKVRCGLVLTGFLTVRENWKKSGHLSGQGKVRGKYFL